MPIGIIISADDSVELTTREFSSLDEYQLAVGGYIEAVDLVEPAFAMSTLIMNEEGKLRGLATNKRATLLLWIHQPALRLQVEVLGDVILVGSEATPILHRECALCSSMFRRSQLRRSARIRTPRNACSTGAPSRAG